MTHLAALTNTDATRLSMFFVTRKISHQALPVQPGMVWFTADLSEEQLLTLRRYLSLVINCHVKEL